MLLTNRRLRLLFIALAGMEAAVFTPYLLLLLHWMGSRWGESGRAAPLGLFLGIWAGLLGMMLALEMLGRSRLSTTAYNLSVVLLVLVTGLLGVRLLIYGNVPISDWRWLRHTGNAVVNFHQGLRPELLLLLFSLFLWYRAANASSRGISFFGVGLSFRLGILLLLLGGGLLVNVAPLSDSVLAVLWPYFGLGLLAVSLARTDDKAMDAAGSTGGILPLNRLAQLILVIALTLGTAAAIAGYYTPDQIRATAHFFAPVWNLISRFLLMVLYVFALVLGRLVFWLFELLRPLLEEMNLAGALAGLAERLALNQPPQETTTPETAPTVPEWVWFSGRTGLVVVVTIVFLGLILLFLARRRQRMMDQEEEEVGRETPTFGGDALRRGWQRLKNWANLVRRYGLGAQLLAAISVENIYANLSRLARRRGYPRQPAQPPDEYLPQLRAAFPGQHAALARITEAYMRVHYGDHPVERAELAALQADYENVRRTPDVEAEASHDLSA